VYGLFVDVVSLGKRFIWLAWRMCLFLRLEKSILVNVKAIRMMFIFCVLI